MSGLPDSPGRRAVGVGCTKEHVYISEPHKMLDTELFWEEFEEDYIDSEYYSDHLFCMDLDGKNEKGLWKGGARTTGRLYIVDRLPEKS